MQSNIKIRYKSAFCTHIDVITLLLKQNAWKFLGPDADLKFLTMKWDDNIKKNGENLNENGKQRETTIN